MVAFALLMAALLYIAWMWLQAAVTGAVPDASWANHQGNHGPWRYRCDLRAMWWQIPEVQVWSLNCALVSLAIKPRPEAAAIAVASTFCCCLFMATHYWLVD